MQCRKPLMMHTIQISKICEDLTMIRLLWDFKKLSLYICRAVHWIIKCDSDEMHHKHIYVKEHAGIRDS